MRINEREKKALFLAGAAVLIAILYQWILVPILNSQETVREKLAAKEIILIKSDAKIAQRERLKRKNKTIQDEINHTEKRLLKGKTPPLAAAELQKLLKEIANKGKIEVRSEKIISPIGVGEYQRIPVRITLKGLVTNLKTVFHQIESNPVFMLISEVSIKVLSARNPSKVEATLTVAGVIKKTTSGDKKTKSKRKKSKYRH